MAMNEQKPPHAIEWTRIVTADGTMRRGFTWNPVAGCHHGCRWKIGGGIVKCYAEAQAEGMPRSYPEGFAHTYWHPERLNDPLNQKEPSGIFLDSMSDLMDADVDEEHVRTVLDVCRRADWHQFILLTKNPGRLLRFQPFPKNVWTLVSSAPDFMRGKELTRSQQESFVEVSLRSLYKLKEANPEQIVGMSAEPLSWDLSALVAKWQMNFHLTTQGERDRPFLDWLIIGAGSNGRKLYQPDQVHVEELLRVVKPDHTRVFYKGNLAWQSMSLPDYHEFPKRWQDTTAA